MFIKSKLPHSKPVEEIYTMTRSYTFVTIKVH